MDSYNELRAVGEAFSLPGEFYSVDKVSIGHINATYKVSYKTEEGFHSYVFQRINTEVFKRPREVMHNIDLVTNFIRTHFPEEQCAYYYKTNSGVNYWLKDGRSFYRVMDFIESVSINETEDLELIEKVGKGFGHFAMQLSDFEGYALFETIQDFHNTKKRLDTLFSDAENDVMGRAKEVQEELRYIASVAEKASEISVKFYEKHEFPVRVTHNDTKSNNILFNKKTKEPIAVIDLDTVMPGMLTYDFGDGIRFIANTAAEDEPDVSKIALSMDKFTAYAKGFLREVKSTVTREEADCMALAAFSVTLETGARFLADYLNGDVYFTDIRYPKHNLVRARDQIALAKDMERKMEEMNAVVRRILEE